MPANGITPKQRLPNKEKKKFWVLNQCNTLNDTSLYFLFFFWVPLHVGRSVRKMAFCAVYQTILVIQNIQFDTQHLSHFSILEVPETQSVSSVGTHCGSGHENSIPTQKSCWVSALSASFHHRAATNQVTALEPISFTLYWRYLRYSVCLPKEKPNGKKKWFPLEIRLQSHSLFFFFETQY